ncbi:MAG: pilus assembly protein TadG-related protein, partial [Gemmatimonadota bacterium]
MVLVALVLVALLGVTALAIDIGMLLTARTEAQRTADAAAHAGAVEWLVTDGDEGEARSTAQQVAAINPVIGEPPAVSDEDVEFLTDPDRVRVTVWRTEDRGNPVPTYFARVLGIDEVDINAVAAAGIANSCGAGCPLPLALIDEWIDVDDDDTWDEGTDQYIPYPEPGYTGYGDDDAGLLIEIKDATQGGGGPPQCADSDTYEACKAFGDPSWDCWWL